MNGQAVAAEPAGFAGARERFQKILGWQIGDSSTGLDHAELERRLDIEGRELLRQLLQDHVDLHLTAIKGTSVKPSFVKS